MKRAFARGWVRLGSARTRWFIRLIAAALGTALAVAGMEVAALWRDLPYGLVPFVTSIALVIGLPGAGPSQPRALIGGHILSSLVGFVVLALLGSSPWSAAVATGASVAVMLATRTMHPPAGIDPFLIVNDALGPAFLLSTVLPGVLVLALFAWTWARLTRMLSGGEPTGTV